MAWVEKDHNDHQVSTPLLCAGSPATRPGCPEPHPACPWMPPGMGHPQPPWATCSSVSPPSVVLEGNNEVSLEPSLFQAKQAQLPQPFLTGEVLQPSDHLSGPLLALPISSFFFFFLSSWNLPHAFILLWRWLEVDPFSTGDGLALWSECFYLLFFIVLTLGNTLSWDWPVTK